LTARAIRPARPLEPAAQALARRRFDDEMQVIGLRRKVDHAEAPTIGRRDRGADRREG
jgi:hypothetical protein